MSDYPMSEPVRQASRAARGFPTRVDMQTISQGPIIEHDPRPFKPPDKINKLIRGAFKFAAKSNPLGLSASIASKGLRYLYAQRSSVPETWKIPGNYSVQTSWTCRTTPGTSSWGSQQTAQPIQCTFGGVRLVATAADPTGDTTHNGDGSFSIRGHATPHPDIGTDHMVNYSTKYKKDFGPDRAPEFREAQVQQPLQWRDHEWDDYDLLKLPEIDGLLYNDLTDTPLAVKNSEIPVRDKYQASLKRAEQTNRGYGTRVTAAMFGTPSFQLSYSQGGAAGVPPVVEDTDLPYFPKPPEKGVKEKKGGLSATTTALWAVARRGLNVVTESADFIGVLHWNLGGGNDLNSFEREIDRKKMARKLFIERGYRAPTFQEKVQEIIDNIDTLDGEAAAYGLALNQVEDMLLGKLGKAVGRESAKQNRPVGFAAGPAI